MGVKIFNKSKSIALRDYYKDIRKLFKISLKHLNINKDYDLSLILVKSDFIHELNKKYRDKDRPTDVISFAMLDYEDAFISEEEASDLGEIYINVDYVFKQADDYGHSIKREFCFLFVHGLLHCLGYDHIEKEDEEVMFKIQKEIVDSWVQR